MKRFLLFFGVCMVTSMFSIKTSTAQNLGQLLSDLKSKLGEITIDKTTFTQSIEVLDESKGKIKYESVAVNEKGESTKTAYEFYISDIDKNTLIRKPSGKKFFVSLQLNNKQKFIKYYKDDKFDSYTENIDILVIGADVAQNVIDILKSAIPQVKNTEKNWNTSAEALNWLKTNIGEIKDKNGTVGQAFTYNDAKNNLLELVVTNTDPKGNVVQEKYNWNLMDINKNKLGVKVSGTMLKISVEIKNGDKYIKYMKGSDLQNYTSSLEISSDDIDQARNIIGAFTAAFDKGKFQPAEFKSLQAALDFVKNNVGEAASDQKSKKQKIEFPGNSKCIFTADEADSKGKTISNQYEFYLSDAEPNVTFRISGKKIILPVLMLGKNKFIRYTRDNNLQNYVEDLEINVNDIETARDMATAMNVALKGSTDSPLKFNNVVEAMKYLQTNVTGASVGTDQYKLSFEANSVEPYGCTYSTSKTDAKSVTTDESYLFYPYLLDPNSIKVGTDGKYLTIQALVNGKKAFIKKIKKDQNSFDSDISVMSFDVKTAKGIAAALKYLAANATPKPKSFTNKQAALDFVKQNLGDITNGAKSIKQKIEIADDNPCKLTLTVNSSDDKGKTTEEVYEFTLLDINKQSVDFKPQGASLSIVLSCKNKQKLVKAYKDGAQQSFGSDVEFLCTDVEVAKNISEAIKVAAAQCE